MAREHRYWISDPRECAYLPFEQASLEYRLMTDVSPDELEGLLERGWRRFGPAYFRPKCVACSECVSLRVPVEKFLPSRQQRRTWNHARGIRLEVGPPRVDDERIELYRAWHRTQEVRRGWADDNLGHEEYFQQFAFPHPCAREFAYYDDQVSPSASGTSKAKLVAVSIVDETPNALSAVYTYHHPDYRRLSLGTASILQQIAIARKVGKRCVYLGYRVLGCRSSEYKARFSPHELLVGWPASGDAPRWTMVERES